MTDLFRAAAEAGPHHILKMYKTNGSVVNISPRLEANSEDSYYRLEVVASDLQSERPPQRKHSDFDCEQSQIFSAVCFCAGVAMPPELDNMEYR